MKKLNRIFGVLLFAAAFTACSDDNYYYEVPDSYRVDFEAAVLGADGYIWGEPFATEQDDEDWMGNPIRSDLFYGSIYAQGDAHVYTYFSDSGHTYDTWNGFVISNHTDMTTAGYTNDKSVYATGGADGSKQFAVAYYGAWTREHYGIPVINFTGAVKPESVAVANTTYLYLYFQNDADAVVDVKAVITGYNSGVKTGTVEVKLADAVAGKVKSGWENVDLSALGTVTELTFTMSTADDMCPLYLAIDNLVYSK
ncbi:DUF4465 domain-containing protein [uncultured Alistipes sp.]|jgi:lipoprotein|uniref:DUF4465 domain-containing protein n=1 Tax=uncultured Alistipes sp. TaxID=538949 RepID=UPI0025F76B9B|nr:DUF4465 domain-containing protein [uncultured Alistipes sp.]